MPGDEWQKFANLRMFLAWMYGHPGKKLVFMGGEFGQWNEWNHDTQLDWELLKLPRHDGLRRLMQHLNYTYKNEPALWQLDDTYDGFDWIDFHDADNSVVSFLRKSRDRRRRGIRCQRDPGRPLQLPARCSRMPDSIVRSSTPMAKRTAEATWETSAAFRAKPASGWVANTRS